MLNENDYIVNMSIEKIKKNLQEIEKIDFELEKLEKKEKAKKESK